MKDQPESDPQILGIPEDSTDVMLAELSSPVIMSVENESGSKINLEKPKPDSNGQFPTFHNAIFDDKTTQLFVFGLLLAKGLEAAKHYAGTARDAGASWKELYTVAELASGVAALNSIQQGAAILNELREDDK